MKKIYFTLFFSFIFLTACTVNRNNTTNYSFIVVVNQPNNNAVFDQNLSVSGTLFSDFDIVWTMISLSNDETLITNHPIITPAGGKLFNFHSDLKVQKAGLFTLRVLASNTSDQFAFSSLLTVSNRFSPVVITWNTNTFLTTNQQTPVFESGIEILSNAFYFVSNTCFPYRIDTTTVLESNNIVVASNITRKFFTNIETVILFLSNITQTTNHTYSCILSLQSTTTQVVKDELSNATTRIISNFVQNFTQACITNTWENNNIIFSSTNLSYPSKTNAVTNIQTNILITISFSTTTNVSTNIYSFITTNVFDILNISNNNQIIRMETKSNILTNGIISNSIVIALTENTNILRSITNFISKLLPQWTQSGDIYTLSANGFTFKVDASKAGKITEYSYNGVQAIVQGNGLYQGSTFWSSPQSWGWPPPANMDPNPYNAELLSNNTVLILTSSPINETGLIQIKRFQSAPETNRMILLYSLSNFTSTNIQAAAWEVSRVDKSSLIYFPKESSYTGSSALNPTTETSSECWYSSGNGKSYRDGGEHWIASYRTGFVFIKSYESNISQSAFAPGESDIEIYGGNDYFEVEEQGAYTTLSPHTTLNWQVIWTLTATPSGMNTSEGSAALINWTRIQVSNL